MKEKLENSEKRTLKKISTTLGVPLHHLSEVYLQIKRTNRATDSDLDLLLKLKIPIYQSIFALMKSHKIHDEKVKQITFVDIKTIFADLISPGGLLNLKIDITPKFQFTSSEAAEIKLLLQRAVKYNRKDRQDILSLLRLKYRFFTTAFTSSRNRFSAETFDQLVFDGLIIIDAN